MASPSKRPMDLPIQCVVLSSKRSEFTFLKNIFRLAGLRLHHAANLVDADVLLALTHSTVLLTDVLFDGAGWRDAVRLVRERHPLVPVLVIADPADYPLLAQLYDCGAAGAIWKPFQFEAVRRQIRVLHEASQERRAWIEEASRPGVYWSGSPR